MSDLVIAALISGAVGVVTVLGSWGVAVLAARKDIKIAAEKERANSPVVYSEAAETLVNQYRMEHDRLSDRIEDLERKLKISDEQIGKQAAEIKQLNTLTRNSASRYVKAETEIKILKREIEELKQENIQLKKENETIPVLRQRIVELEKKVGTDELKAP